MFSVVIPTYNSTKTIEVPIDSLNRQTFKDFEVIFADDGSTDLHVLRDLVATQAKFQYRISPLPQHVNESGARNHGVAQATRPYICFLDSDDAWAPEKLEEIAAYVTQHKPVPDIIFHQVICRKESGESFIYPSRGPEPSQNVLEYLFFDNGLIQPTAMVCKRQTCADIGFDEALQTHADWDFLGRAGQAGRTFAFIDKPLATWMVRRMIGRGGRDKSAASMFWFNRSGALFNQRARTGFLVNIVLPKLVAEGQLAAATRLLLANAAGCPLSTAMALVRLAQRAIAKSRTRATRRVQPRAAGNNA